MADTVCIFLPVVLRRKDAGAGNCSEQAEVIDKQDLVDNGNTGHGLRADLTDHNIVQHVYKVCDTVLNHDWDSNHKYHLIKSGVAEVFLPEIFHLDFLL